MREILHKSTGNQISLCIDFLKIWARQGVCPNFCPSRLMHFQPARYAHDMLLLCTKLKPSLLRFDSTSTVGLAKINAGVSPTNSLKIGKVQRSRDQISLRTLPIAVSLILSFSGAGIWTCVSLRISTSELTEPRYLFLKSAAINMKSSARLSMSRFTCRTHLSSQSTMK